MKLLSSCLTVYVYAVLQASKERSAFAFDSSHSSFPSKRRAVASIAFSSSHSLQAVSRRHVLETGTQATSSWLLASASQSNTSSSNSSSSSGSSNSESSSAPVADLEMIRLQLPKGGFGREFLAIPLMVQGQGPYEFMVDTGLTTELITPHLQKVLGIRQDSKSPTIQGLSAGGASSQVLTELRDVTFCRARPGTPDTMGDKDNLIHLPVLHAVVTDFPQEHIDPAHDPIEGMIGMEALSLFDCDFDFPRNRLRLYRPGTVSQAARQAGMVEIPAAVINETGLIAIRVRTPESQQPILGFLDCGSAFSVVNSAAATVLGLSKSDSRHAPGPTVAGIGIDGRPLPMPTFSTTLTFAGAVEKDPATGRPVGFTQPPRVWRPWSPIPLAVGDIPAFSTILGDGIKPFNGPAALIGLDILSQRRVILETAEPGNVGSRRRRVWVSP